MIKSGNFLMMRKFFLKDDGIIIYNYHYPEKTGYG